MTRPPTPYLRGQNKYSVRNILKWLWRAWRGNRLQAGLNASIGVQDSVNGVNQTVGFNQYVNVPTYQVMQFIPGTGTDPWRMKSGGARSGISCQA